MYILGDIGNTDTKLCLVSTKNKIIKKITFQSKNLNQKKLSKYFSLLKPDYQIINKILFCSVVPKSFNLIKKFISKKTIEKYYKKKIVFKKPNDLLINKKKISGILQEIISVSGNEFLIIGIGVNLIKSPKIKNYPTTNLSELINKPINKIDFENELKVIFVKNLSRMYKINNKVNKK